MPMNIFSSRTKLTANKGIDKGGTKLMPSQDFSHKSKVVRCLSPVDVTAVADQVGEPIDTRFYEGLVIYFATGLLTDFVSSVLFEEADTSGGAYTTITDSRLIGIAADVTHAADDDDKVAQIGVRNVKRFVRITYQPTTAATANLVSAVAVLFAPQRSRDTTAAPAKFN